MHDPKLNLSRSRVKFYVKYSVISNQTQPLAHVRHMIRPRLERVYKYGVNDMILYHPDNLQQ